MVAKLLSEMSFEEHQAECTEYEARNGGRQPMTVGEAIELLSTFPADTPFKVSHQHRYHAIGIHDPLPIRSHKIATIVDVDHRGHPIMGGTGLSYVIVE